MPCLTDMQEKIYDVLVIGGGPAGYTAALYAVRAGLSCAVVERLAAGGQMCETAHIENYPGVGKTDGFALGDSMKSAAEQFGAKTVFAEVTAVELTGDIKTVTTDSGVLSARTVIVATGATHRHLGLAREEELIGRGVGYCAACDGMLYRGKHVVLVGGGNSAAADALYLSGICTHVTMVHRRDTLRASRIHCDEIAARENITVCWNSEVVELLGEGRVEGVRLQNNKTGALTALDADGVFISIGREPHTALFAGQLTLDAVGYIVADETTKTNLAGVFAAGDVRTKPLRQIVTATADGATAAHFAEEYIQKRGL